MFISSKFELSDGDYCSLCRSISFCFVFHHNEEHHTFVHSASRVFLSLSLSQFIYIDKLDMLDYAIYAPAHVCVCVYICFVFHGFRILLSHDKFQPENVIRNLVIDIVCTKVYASNTRDDSESIL